MKSFLSLLLLLPAALAFVSQVPKSNHAVTALFAEDENKGGLFGGIKNFFEELDAFVDDASARRLGAGASFYGKRKSNFYGESDKMKKADKNVYDPSEDYRVTAAGNYKWMEDEDGVLRPVTRLKNKIMEKN
ncbi:expressed unknown protein [Seminavis robusta]|uniref:Uncharacterized protein n=1 Tax=Seminavis robusta TaxID=568900 RepID=A0A9N8DWV0_9STRA|nr:expressed unknown protein [Seminavis robusta]|eukprot:Sro436_g142600.1 n/a (132) ;mRNA; r:26154-26755